MKNKTRMIQWFAIALSFHIAAAACSSLPWPQISTVFWKMGNMTAAAYLGYWVDRNLFHDRLTVVSDPIKQMRRAIIVVGAMISIAMGM